MIGIIGAMSVEVEELKARLTDAKVEEFAGSEYVSGRLCGREVVIAQCGIGKVFAAVCASTMILRYNVSAIINTGVAGTLSEKVGILDFAVSDAVVFCHTIFTHIQEKNNGNSHSNRSLYRTSPFGHP